MQFEQQGDVVAERYSKAPFIFKHKNALHALTDQVAKQIGAVLPRPVESLRKGKTRKGRQQAGFYKVGIAACFEPDNQFVFVLTIALRNDRPGQCLLQGHYELAKEKIVVMHPER